MNERGRVSIMRKSFFLFIIFFFSFSSVLLSEENSKNLLMEGRFFKKGETQITKSRVIFEFEKWTIKSHGETRSFLSLFKDIKGKVVAREKLLLRGNKPLRYELEQFQVNEQAIFVLKKGNSLEMLYRKGKVEKKDNLKWEEDYILPLMIPDYIKAHSLTLTTKGSMEVELIVPHLQRSISFTFYLQKKIETSLL